jgi:hypothetical protein
MMFLHSAKYVHDVESGLDYVQIEYDKYSPYSKEYDTHVDNLATRPLGSWAEIHSLKKSVKYDKFLNSMVEQTVEVMQKMCEVTLTNIVNDLEPSTKAQIWLMHTMRILDPSFTPPWINVKSAWQRAYVAETIEHTFFDLIERTVNTRRLEKLFNVLKLIEIELTM